MGHKAKQFIFESFDFSLKTGELILRYGFDNGLKFEEKFYFPPEKFVSYDKEILLRAIKTLFLYAGMSYWKLYCPREIVCEDPLSEKEAEFFNTVYTKGLGEFFYKNQIDFRGLVQFPFQKNVHPKILPSTSKKNYRALIPFGGGKDSAVTASLLKEAGKSFSVLTLRTFPVIEKFAAKIGGEHIVVGREMGRDFFEFEKTHEVYQGHIPVTGLYSSVVLVSAILYGFDDIVLSSERSANEGNLEYLGEVINHQWSKSLEFEELFSEYIHDFVSPSIRYFSLLRSLSELKIAEIFSKHKEFFPYFVSCNKNFLFGKETDSPFWCNECAKCLFTFILLSAWLPKKELIEIFGKNLFEEEKLFPVFKELLGIAGHKPFECVGEIREISAALILASQKKEFEGDFLMKYFQGQVLPGISGPDTLVRKSLTREKNSNIPEEYAFF